MYGDSNEFDSFTGQSSSANQPPVQYEWFDKLLQNRFMHAKLYSATLLTFLFYTAVVFYQISVLHPFLSVLSLFYVLFSTNFLVGAICIFVYGYFLTGFFISKCFHPLYEMNYNIAKYQVVMAALGMFVSYMFIWLFVVNAALSTVYASWTTFILFASTAFFSSYQTALSVDFRWQCTKEGVIPLFRRIWRSLLLKSGRDLARNVTRGYMVAALLCMLVPSFRFTFFDLILALSTNVSNFFIVFALHVAAYIVFEMINSIVMQPIELPLISQATPGRPSRQQQNLINAITSENDLLREFGFFALNDIARKSSASREIIFSLSQPGKKPRNWTTIYEVCTRVIDVTREMLQLSTGCVETQVGERKTNGERLLNFRPVNTPTIRPIRRRPIDEPNGGTDFNLLNESKKRLLQPPQLNPRAQVTQKPRPQILHTKLSFVPGYSYLEHWINAFSSTFLRPTPSVSSYYMKLCEYCVDTLSVLAAHSIEEDKYGVVQPHLADINSSLLRLELAVAAAGKHFPEYLTTRLSSLRAVL